jgi:hypothetical protein
MGFIDLILRLPLIDAHRALTFGGPGKNMVQAAFGMLATASRRALKPLVEGNN